MPGAVEDVRSYEPILKDEHDTLLTGDFASLTLPGGQTIKLPMLVDSAGCNFVDIRKLYSESGACCFDPGFTSTASCHSEITYIDGNRGLLLYRGLHLCMCVRDTMVCICSCPLALIGLSDLNV